MLKLILVCIAATLLIAYEADALIVAPVVATARIMPPAIRPLGGIHPFAVGKPVTGPLGAPLSGPLTGKREAEVVDSVRHERAHHAIGAGIGAAIGSKLGKREAKIMNGERPMGRGLLSGSSNHGNTGNKHTGAKSAIGAGIGAAIGSKLGKREAETMNGVRPMGRGFLSGSNNNGNTGSTGKKHSGVKAVLGAVVGGIIGSKLGKRETNAMLESDRTTRGAIGAGVGAAVGSKLGKREIMNANITECVLSSESSKMVCAGVHSLSCDLSYNFTGLGNFSFIVKDLALHKIDLEVIDKVKVMEKEPSVIADTNIEKMESIKKIEKHIEPVYQFLAESEIVEHKVITEAHTFVNPRDNKPIVLSLYWNEDMSDCLGFRIKEHSCWEQFEKIVESVKPEELEFELVMSQLESVTGKKIELSAVSDNLPSTTPIVEKITSTTA